MMNILPVLARELELAVRRRSTYYARCGSVLVVTGICLSLIYAGFVGFMKPATAGRNLFLTLSLVGYAYVLLEGILRTVDAVSEEKREGTIGLLFLTDLNSPSIILGKLVARVLPPAGSLLAALPALGLALFMGGVTGHEFLRMMLALVNALFYASALGLFISSVCRSDRLTFGLGMASLLVPGLALPAAGLVLQQTASLNTIPWPFMVPSPASPILELIGLGRNVAVPASPGTFWVYLATSNAAGWIWLALASCVLSRTWREFAQPPPKSSGSKSTGTAPSVVPFRDRIASRVNQRQRRLLDDQPLLWVGERERFERFAWASFALFLIIFFAVVWFEPTLLNSPVVMSMGAAALHGVLVVGAALHTSRGPAQDRRSGVMEVLATTPLGPEMIIRGRMLAFKRQTIRPLLALLLLNAMICVWAAQSLEMAKSIALALLLMGLTAKTVIDLYVASWLGLWQGLKARSTTAAVRRTLSYLFLWRWLAFVLMVGMLGLLTNGSVFRDNPGVAMTTIVVGYFTLLAASHSHFCALAQSEVRDDLRALVLPA